MQFELEPRPICSNYMFKRCVCGFGVVKLVRTNQFKKSFYNSDPELRISHPDNSPSRAYGIRGDKFAA